MEAFRTINPNNTLESLQEDPLFIIRFLADVSENLEPLVKSFFGFNRLKIGDLVNETLDTIQNLTKTADMNRKRRRCVDNNKKVLLLLFQTSLSNWQCINRHIIDFFEIFKPVWDTIFGFTVINDDDCSVFNPFCLVSRGVETARLTAEMLKHSGAIMVFGADFVLTLRTCQQNVEPFELISQKVLKNIEICTVI